MINSVIICGSGNVAFHLARAFSSAGILIKQIYSRNTSSGNELADIAKCGFTNNLLKIETDADAYVFAMNDSANTEVAKLIKTKDNAIFLHTAGSLSMNIFQNKTKNYGVFYPFQTFSKDIDLDFSRIPICIEASNSQTLIAIIALAEKLSCKFYEIDEDKRKTLHLAGVFACNFMNHCVFLGEEILKSEGIPHDLLKPLLEQSFSKLLDSGAYSSQTGPALRNDKISIEKHLEYLQNDKNLSDIYNLLSSSIYKTYNK
jgi:predicted short-subunit dehydrogenase-like oxidoreductase (DUF2520 family)